MVDTLVKWRLPGLVLMLLLLSADRADAVEFSAFMSAPQAGQQEWFELYNPDSEDVSLLGWQVWDQLSQPSLLLSLSTTLSAQATLRFTLSQAQLNNSGDGLTLYNNSGEIVDQISYQSSLTGIAWIKINGTWQLDQLSPTPTATPSAEPTVSALPTATSIPTPTITATPTPQPTPKISLNNLALDEINYCSSSDEAEWLVLENLSEQNMQLNNWQVKDAVGQSYQFNLFLAAKSKNKVEWKKHFLNNTGDTVYLYTGENVLWITQVLPECQEGKTWKSIQPTAKPTSEIDLGPSPTPTIVVEKASNQLSRIPPTIPDVNSLAVDIFGRQPLPEEEPVIASPQALPKALIVDAIMSFLALAGAGGLLWYEK